MMPTAYVVASSRFSACLLLIYYVLNGPHKQKEIAMLKSAPNSSNEGVLKRKALSESELKVASICLFKYLHLNT